MVSSMKVYLKTKLDRGCLAVDGQAVKLPDKGDKIDFRNHVRKFKTPYVIYADFECLTTKSGCYSKPLPPGVIDYKKSIYTKISKTCSNWFLN